MVSTVSRIVTSWSVPEVDRLGAVVALGRQHDGVGGVIDIEVLAAGRPGAPHVDRRGVGLDRLDRLLDQRRDDVGHRRVELVARSVEVGRDQIGEALPVLRGVDLGVDELRLLGDAVRRVGLLGVAVPQARLLERHGRELRVRAHGAEQHRLVDAGRGPSGLDDVGAHHQVGQVQRRRLGLVEADATDTGGEVDHAGGLVLGQQQLGHAGHGEVVVGLAGHDDVGAEIPQPGDHPSTEEPRAPGDQDRTAAPELRHPFDATESTRRHHGRVASDATSDRPRVAYTVEQCWHRVPGGTAVAALAVARALLSTGELDLRFVAGRHRDPPAPAYRVPGPVAQLALPRPVLYESWLRWQRPRVERATGPVDVTHATGLVPCPTAAPLVVTVHDVAFVHQPDRFTRQGARVMRRSLDVIRDRAAVVITSSEASARDLRQLGIDGGRLRVVPLGVEPVDVTDAQVAQVRRDHGLPERFVLFVGTLEPRKNLRRLAAAVAVLGGELPLVVAGPDGWGSAEPVTGDVRFLGFVPAGELPALYAAATVLAYPSEWEGFGLPVAEAMAQGTPVVTSAGRSTEEVAGGAAVLVDPLDVDAIADGLASAVARADELSVAGRVRAGQLTWTATAAATRAVYDEAMAGGGVTT